MSPFLKNNHSFPKPIFRGRIDEYPFWEIENDHNSHSKFNSIFPTQISIDSTHGPFQHFQQSRENPTNNNEVIVYSTKKKKNQEDIAPRTQLEQSHETDLNPETKERQPGNPESSSIPSESQGDDLDVPIAIRKKDRSCTKHPIYNFISYDGLSPGFHALPLV